jgi:hypothetical protein
MKFNREIRFWPTILAADVLHREPSVPVHFLRCLQGSLIRFDSFEVNLISGHSALVDVHKRCSSKVSCWLSLKSAVRDSLIPVQLFLQHNRDIAPFQQLLFERGNSLFTTSELGFWKYLWEL